MAKNIKVADILDLMEDEQVVNCVFYAYGIFYGCSLDDEMLNVKECKNKLRYDCLNAKVYKINSSDSGDQPRTVIHAEIVQ